MNPTYAEVEAALLGRWPETRLDPSLDRITALLSLLGDPQRSYPVVQLTGTNGKTSTARMIDALLRSLDLRTGRFTSPHLSSMTERISLDGEMLSEELFVEAFADVAAYAQIVDDSQPHPVSFFELTVAMAYAAFADAPVDAAVVEVGMGGTWDATNVADAKVAVITPIAVDHSAYLGHDAVDIAREKAGIIKPGGHVVIAEQEPEVLDVILQRSAEVGATVLREGVDFAVADRLAAVGGQQVALQGVGARYDEVLLTLHGQFQAHNAALALAAVEALTGSKELEAEIVRDGFAEVDAPGRLEVVRRGPTVIVDAAHNPHGIAASVASLQEEFALSPLVVVLGVMADKDVEEIVRGIEPVASHVVCTQNSTDRSMSAGELGEIVEDVLGDAAKVSVVRSLPDALERAIERAETTEGYEDAVGSGGVLVTGSVITAGQARLLLARDGT
ncbi:bifunctional folylpolyglutamate synthase/dihydrofolate synthase [Aeromicrobium sp. CTD01-1L150]|uniref:bifunctional folylpolyglutamate synthase/dihydrofolate synthase n=1 Tax=Aeromicrobium sp. CTD01-1L150 TaxID=3341830 RepID=UPI0035C0830C